MLYKAFKEKRIRNQMEHLMDCQKELCTFAVSKDTYTRWQDGFKRQMKIIAAYEDNIISLEKNLAEFIKKNDKEDIEIWSGLLETTQDKLADLLEGEKGTTILYINGILLKHIRLNGIQATPGYA